MIISFPPHFVNAYHLFVTIVKLIKKTAVDTQYLQPKFTYFFTTFTPYAVKSNE